MPPPKCGMTYKSCARRWRLGRPGPASPLRPEGWDLQKVTLPWRRTFELGLEPCVGVEGPQSDNQAAD
jgi:hypothetical protein